MRYLCQCSSCGQRIGVTRSIVDGPPEYVPCDGPGCGGEAARVWTSPEVHTPGAFIPFTHLGPNLAEKAGRTPEQQERIYSKIIESGRKVRAEKKRSLGKRAEGRFESHEIPRELWVARERQFGKNYWREEGMKALKRDGLV